MSITIYEVCKTFDAFMTPCGVLPQKLFRNLEDARAWAKKISPSRFEDEENTPIIGKSL